MERSLFLYNGIFEGFLLCTFRIPYEDTYSGSGDVLPTNGKFYKNNEVRLLFEIFLIKPLFRFSTRFCYSFVTLCVQKEY